MAGLLALGLLCACGSGSGGDAGEDGAGQRGASESPRAETSAPAPEPFDLTGIVSVGEDEEDDGCQLEFADPAMPGTADRVIPLPGEDSGGGFYATDCSAWTRSSFSSDFRYAVWGGARSGNTIHVAELDEASGTYAELFTIEAGEDTYSEIADRYGNPAFSPVESTLWLERDVDDRPSTLSSLDLSGDTDPAADMRHDETLELREQGFFASDEPSWGFDSAGAPMIFDEDEAAEIGPGDGWSQTKGDWFARYWPDGEGAMLRPTLTVWEGDSSIGTDFVTVERLGPTEFAMIANGSGYDPAAAANHGLVTRVTFDIEAETVAFEPMAPLGASETLAHWGVLSPDGGTVLFCLTSGDLYQASVLTPGEEPAEVGECSSDSAPLEWR